MTTIPPPDACGFCLQVPYHEAEKCPEIDILIRDYAASSYGRDFDIKFLKRILWAYRQHLLPEFLKVVQAEMMISIPDRKDHVDVALAQVRHRFQVPASVPMLGNPLR